MPNNIWLGSSLENTKTVTVSAGPNIVSLSPSIKVGLGASLLTFAGWDADSIAATWNASLNPLLSDVLATSDGSTLTFTAKTPGQDFEITCYNATAVANGVSEGSALQSLTFSPAPSGGTFTLTVAGSTTGAITYSATPATLRTNIQTAINALGGFGTTDVVVTVGTSSNFLFDFSQGRFVGTVVALVTMNGASLTGGTAGVTVTTLTNGTVGVNQVVSLSFPFNGTHSEAVNEVQKLTATAQAGSFSLTLVGYGTTDSIPITAGRSSVQTALESLVGVGNVFVTGGPLYYPTDGTNYVMLVTFVGSLAGINIPLLVTAVYNTGINEIQQLSLGGHPTAGTFTMTFGGQTTSSLNWNATAAQVQTALVALSSIGANNVICAGGPLSPAYNADISVSNVTTQFNYISNSGAFFHTGDSVYEPFNISLGGANELQLRIFPTTRPVHALLRIPYYDASGSGLTIAATGLRVAVADQVGANYSNTSAQQTALSTFGTVTCTLHQHSTDRYGYVEADVSALVSRIQDKSGYILSTENPLGNGDAAGAIVFRITSVDSSFIPLFPTLPSRSLTGAVYTSLEEEINDPVLDPSAPVTISFTGALGAANQAAITTTSGTLSPVIKTLRDGGTGTVTPSSVTDGGTATIANISGGTFSLIINGTVVRLIPYNATAAQVVGAINGQFGATVCSATGGPAPGTPIVITFINTLQKTPLTVTFLSSLITSAAGSVTKTELIPGSYPPIGLNAWDLVVSPGAGTLGVNSSNFSLQINTSILSTSSRTTVPNLGVISLPLAGLNADIVQEAINRYLGIDACRVVRIGHSQEWKAYSTTPFTNVSQYPAYSGMFWFMKDTYRITFINELAASGSVSISTSLGSVSSFMATPTNINDEVNRVIYGFLTLENSTSPAQTVSCTPAAYSSVSQVAYRTKLISRPSSGTIRNGIAEPIRLGKIRFTWNLRSLSDTGVETLTALATSDAIDWDSSASTIQSVLQRISTGFFGADNVLVSGSLRNSWKSESSKDNPDQSSSYNELRIALVGQLAALPVDYQYCLSCGPVSGSQNYAADTVFNRDWALHTEKVSASLPPYLNRKVRVSISSIASVSSLVVSLGNNCLPCTITIAPTLTAAQIQAALAAIYPMTTAAAGLLPEKSSVPVMVYGTTFAEGPMDFEFSSFSGQQNPGSDIVIAAIPTTTIVGAVAVTTAGVAAVDENQLVSLTGNPTSGTWTLSWGGHTTASLAYNVSLSTFTAALATASISLTAVTGDAVNGFTLNWAGAGGDRAQATAASSLTNTLNSGVFTNINIGGASGSLTVTETVKGRGPNFYDDYNNWSLNRLPNSSDTLTFDDAPSAVLYGLDMTSTFIVTSLATPSVFTHSRRRPVFDNGQRVHLIGTGTPPSGLTFGTEYFIANATGAGSFTLQSTLAADITVTTTGSGTFTLILAGLTLNIYSRFTGQQIGLTHLRNGVVNEYLPNYLKAYFTAINIGIEAGNGLNLGRFDTMDGETAIHVINSGATTIAPIPAILFLANNASTSLIMDAGSVGLSVYSGETTVMGAVTLTQGSLKLANATITTLTKRANATVTVLESTVDQTINLD